MLAIDTIGFCALIIISKPGYEIVNGFRLIYELVRNMQKVVKTL